MDSVSADNRRNHSEEELDKVDQSPTGLHAGLRRIPDKFPRVALLILVVEVGCPTAHVLMPKLVR
jgi:POT family proton-dependent oligopeptide transporter